jgi:hypothetical protein
MIQIVQYGSPLMCMNSIVLPFTLIRNRCLSEEVSSSVAAHWRCFALPRDWTSPNQKWFIAFKHTLIYLSLSFIAC